MSFRTGDFKSPASAIPPLARARSCPGLEDVIGARFSPQLFMLQASRRRGAVLAVGRLFGGDP